MKLSELMAGITPSASYAGPAQTDDFVLAVDIAESASPKERRLCGGAGWHYRR